MGAIKSVAVFQEQHSLSHSWPRLAALLALQLPVPPALTDRKAIGYLDQPMPAAQLGGDAGLQ